MWRFGFGMANLVGMSCLPRRPGEIICKGIICYINIYIYKYVMYTYVWRLRVMSFKNSGCDLSEPAQVIGRLSHLQDVTQYVVSESPLLRPQTALEERSRPRIIGSHVLVWLGDQNFDVDLDDYCWCVVLTCWGPSPGCIGHRCFQPQKCRHRFEAAL